MHVQFPSQNYFSYALKKVAIYFLRSSLHVNSLHKHSSLRHQNSEQQATGSNSKRTNSRYAHTCSCLYLNNRAREARAESPKCGSRAIGQNLCILFRARNANNLVKCLEYIYDVITKVIYCKCFSLFSNVSHNIPGSSVPTNEID